MPCLLILLLLWLGAGCKPEAVPTERNDTKRSAPQRSAASGAQGQATRRAEAEASMVAASSNAIAGFKRIINPQISDAAGTNLAEWRAEAEVEFVSQAGEVARTNLPFVFQWVDEKVQAAVDYQKLGEAELKAWQERMDKRLAAPDEKEATRATDLLVKQSRVSHIWALKDGTSVTGYFVSFDGTNVLLKKDLYDPADTLHKLQISALCEEDQKLLGRLRALP
jgi:hypothetical protein